MKHLKQIILIILFFSAIGFSFHSITELYTKKTIKALADECVKSATYNRGWNQWADFKGNATILPSPLFLGNLLYSNIYAQKTDSTDSWKAGRYTDISYKNGWRLTLVKNQDLAYKSIDEYGSLFIQEFNSGLLSTRDSLIEKFKDSKSIKDSLSLFTLEDYWKRQMVIFERYEILTNELLKLDNSLLMMFIDKVGKEQYPCCGQGQPATEVHAWLFYSKLIGKMPFNYYNYEDDPFTDGGWFYEKYPLDLLLLTYRIQKDFPQWQAKRFLTEVQKFNNTVKIFLVKEEEKKLEEIND